MRPLNSSCTFKDMSKYPNLDAVAKKLANDFCKEINDAAMKTQEPSMPYKAQYILEEVIKILKDRV